MHVTWPVEVGPESPFPITNIPFGVFSTQDSVSFLYKDQCLKYSILTVCQPGLRVGIAIGEYILDLSCLEEKGMFQDLLQHREVSKSWNHENSGTKKSIFAQASLNSFAALPKATRSAIRNKIIDILQYEDSTLFSDPALNNEAFHEQCKAKMHLPMQIGDFTDFLCSRTHADNVSLPSLCALSTQTANDPSVHAWLAFRKGLQPTSMPSRLPIMGEVPPSLSAVALCIDRMACCDSLPLMITNSVPLVKWTTNWSLDSSSLSLLSMGS